MIGFHCVFFYFNRRSLALFVHECADGISFAMQKALKNGKNQSSGLVFLGIMENRTVDWRFGHFDKKITINETKLGEKLLENIYSGKRRSFFRILNFFMQLESLFKSAFRKIFGKHIINSLIFAYKLNLF